MLAQTGPIEWPSNFTDTDKPYAPDLLDRVGISIYQDTVDILEEKN